MIVVDKLETGKHAVFVEMASRRSIVISWWYRPTNDDLTRATVEIHRGYSRNGHFDLVGTVRADVLHYRDTGSHVHDKWREIYFKLRVINLGGAVDETEPFSVRSQPTLEAIAVRKRTDLALRFEGVPCLIYVRRGEGVRCPDCWDPGLKKVMSSSCPTCFNTGRLGGFYPPILTQVRISPATKHNEPGDTLRQVEQVTAVCSFIPIVSPRDVVYEVNVGKRWRIVTVQPTEDHRVIVHQDLMMIGLNPGDIEHTLPIPTGLTPIIREWRDVRTYPQRPLVRDHDTRSEEDREGKAEADVDFLVVDL